MNTYSDTISGSGGSTNHTSGAAIHPGWKLLQLHMDITKHQIWWCITLFSLNRTVSWGNHLQLKMDDLQQQLLWGLISPRTMSVPLLDIPKGNLSFTFTEPYVITCVLSVNMKSLLILSVKSWESWSYFLSGHCLLWRWQFPEHDHRSLPPSSPLWWGSGNLSNFNVHVTLSRISAYRYKKSSTHNLYSVSNGGIYVLKVTDYFLKRTIIIRSYFE